MKRFDYSKKPLCRPISFEGVRMLGVEGRAPEDAEMASPEAEIMERWREDEIGKWAKLGTFQKIVFLSLGCRFDMILFFVFVA